MEFFFLFFSIEPVDIWNCEILLTASLDCTVRLWTMEGHFVGTSIRGDFLTEKNCFVASCVTGRQNFIEFICYSFVLHSIDKIQSYCVPPRILQVCLAIHLLEWNDAGRESGVLHMQENSRMTHSNRTSRSEIQCTSN